MFNYTFLTEPQHTRLVSLERARRELNLDSSKDVVLTDIIDSASDAISRACDRVFARHERREHRPGTGTGEMLLNEYPTLLVEEVAFQRYDGSEAVLTASDYRIADTEAGQLQRLTMSAQSSYFGGLVWDETRIVKQWLEPHPTSVDGPERWRFDYWAGYLLPDDNVTSSGHVGVTGATSKYTRGDGDWPLLLVGDRITVAGFAQSANNGRKTVVSRSATELVVAETLVDETQGAVVAFDVQTLPRGLERLAMRQVRADWFLKQRDPSMLSERLADWEAVYGTFRQTAAEVATLQAAHGLEQEVAFGLAGWTRLVR